jgi:lysine-N-methylase
VSAIPYRPRLGERATLRRHAIDGIERSYVHDAETEELLEIDAEQLAVLRACDGTRDLGGVMLAVAREGAYRRASAVEASLAELCARGLLADGLPPPAAESVRAPERPLEVLDLRLSCSRSGACCRVYPSIGFEPQVARRALVLAPEVLGGDERRVFTPLSSAAGERLAVTQVDGACAYLGAAGSCSLHAAHGAAAKPAGCRQFPVTLVDDGEAVRVSVAVECPCVVESALGAGGGEALVPEGAAREADLSEVWQIGRLPARVAVTARRAEDRAALRVWSAAVLAAPPADALAGFWALGEAAERYGLDAAAAREACAAPAPPAEALATHLAALAPRTAAKRASADRWRSSRDRARLLAAWLEAAAAALLDATTVQARLDAPGAPEEAFYLRALVHGHLLASPRVPLAVALRDRAVRVLLARQAATVADRAGGDPSASCPITAVDAMMRAQGLAGYVLGLGEPP